MHYFAYGSNMSLRRLRERVPSARSLGCYRLAEHDLRFHKPGVDGSGKCDAFYTGQPGDELTGVLFEIDPQELSLLDRAEGCGYGYEHKTVTLCALHTDKTVTALTYVATQVQEGLQPFTWYLNHLQAGAQENGLPQAYIADKIEAVSARRDPDIRRDRIERDIHRTGTDTGLADDFSDDFWDGDDFCTEDLSDLFR